MKTVQSYILALGAAAMLGMTMSGCQDDVDAPFIDVPVAVNEANTTIAELKAAFWQDAANYADTVRTKEDGSHYIIKGRVVSSDEQGNVFKFLSIQDETGAITFSVNSYNLYLNYRRGQEIVVDATGMYIGKYAGLQQFGSPSYYENGSTWQVGFMSPQFFQQHIELNGVPEVAKLDTLDINSFTDLDSSPEGLRKWQGQLVRFNNVHFLDGGVKTFSAYHSNNNDDVNKTIVDSEGNSNVVVRTSGYATFWNKMLPAGEGDIVGILSFYQNLAGASMWQLILNDYDGCMNFGNPTVKPGTESNPYSVEEVVKLEEDGTVASGWVTGYIVGADKPSDNGEVISNKDINWGSEAFIMPYILVIGADKETEDLAQAIVVELPADTPLREYGNLRDNPGNYGKQIWIRGNFEKVKGTYGLTGNSGASSQFKIEGVDGGNVPEGDGTADKPYNASQAKAKAIENGSASTENVYVKGYIVSGSINMQYGTGTWTIADNPEGTGETFELYGTYNTDNQKFTEQTKNDVKVGDLVVAVGPIFNYNSKTPEMSKGHLVSINAGGATTPSSNVIYSESFQNGNLGDFTTTVETSGTWGGWKPNTNSTSPACAIANSYINSVNEAATAWLISPAINLADAKTASVKVEQAFGFYFPTKQEEFCTLNIREKDGQWQQLTLTNFPPKGEKNWTSFAENTVDISAFAGKTVEIGFKYYNDGNQSVAWEIKNFSVIADGGSTVTPDPTPDPTPGPTPEPGETVSILASAITTVPGTSIVDGFTFTIDKASGLSTPILYQTSAVRLYADNTLQISGPRMASITFTLASSNDKRYTTVTPSTGSITPAQATGDTSFTWVGDASSVTFTVGHDATLGSDGSGARGQIHFTKVEITTAK